MFMKIAVRLIGLISTMILARLLLPEDFGLIAIASMVFGTIEIMGVFSFDLALIRDEKMERSRYDSAWTLGVIRGFVVALLLALIAPAAAIFFQDPRLESVIYVLCIASILEGFQNIGTVDFQKNLEFHRVFLLRIIQKVAATITTVVLAVLWQDYWALVAGIMVGRVSALILSYSMHPYRPRFARSEWRSLFDFSKWLLIRNMLLYANKRIDEFMLGRLFGTYVLGIYTVGKEIALLPSSELMAPMQRALFPGYARLAGDRDRLRRAYLRTVAMILMIIAPCAVGLALVAKPLVIVLLGEQWIEAIPILKILALVGLLGIGDTGVTAVLLALGKPQYLLYISLGDLMCRVPLMMGGAYLGGVVGVAYGLLVTTMITQMVRALTISRTLDLQKAVVFRTTWRTPIAIVTMVMALKGFWMMVSLLGFTGTPIINLIGSVVVGAAAYITAHLGLWYAVGCPEGAESHVFDLASSVWHRWRPANSVESS